MTIQYIVFDLDGTITDSHLGIIKGMQFAMSKLDLPIPTAEELDWCIGPPLEDNFAKLIPHSTPDKVQQGCDWYHEYYEAHGMFENAVYPGLQKVLQTLHHQGYPLYIATSKLEPHAKAILAHFDLAKYFTGIHGASRDGHISRKVDVIDQVLSQHHLDPKHGMMIGDHNVDVAGGNQHGMFSIGVVYGYGTESELMAAKPNELCYDPEQLGTLLTRILQSDTDGEHHA